VVDELSEWLSGVFIDSWGYWCLSKSVKKSRGSAAKLQDQRGEKAHANKAFVTCRGKWSRVQEVKVKENLEERSEKNRTTKEGCWWGFQLTKHGKNVCKFCENRNGVAKEQDQSKSKENN